MATWKGTPGAGWARISYCDALAESRRAPLGRARVSSWRAERSDPRAMVAARCIAVDVLGSLCLLKEGRGEICLRGCLPQLFKLLESKHGKMRAAATKARAGWRQPRV